MVRPAEPCAPKEAACRCRLVQEEPGAQRVDLCRYAGMHARLHDPVGRRKPILQRARQARCRLGLQARGTDLIKRGSWKGTLDCQIVSRGSGVAQAERAAEGAILCGTACIDILNCCRNIVSISQLIGRPVVLSSCS